MRTATDVLQGSSRRSSQRGGWPGGDGDSEAEPVMVEPVRADARRPEPLQRELPTSHFDVKPLVPECFQLCVALVWVCDRDRNCV